MAEAFLVGGARTPVGRYGGALSTVRPDDLAALTITAAVDRAGIDPDAVDEVILGNANGAGEENRNVARMAWLLAGYPDTVPASRSTVCAPRACPRSSWPRHMVRAGAADLVVAGGVESMSRAPWVMAKPATAFAKPGAVFDTSIGWRFPNPAFLTGEQSRGGKAAFSMPETAEEVARVFAPPAQDCDAFAVRSHERALAAIQAGRFVAEIVPVTVRGRKGAETVVETDEGPATPGRLSRCSPGCDRSWRAGRWSRPATRPRSTTVRRRSSSPRRRRVERFDLTPRARILERRIGGCRARDHGHRSGSRRPARCWRGPGTWSAISGRSS